ncbi:MAG: sigma-70 family RNA polymerase sigma factor [Armatimonadetes bacterium]|jgi:RNA polymerase sigma-70 factor (ECF subfamily)|nr:sigma-70 family RNA polymerase sigma factor [Armatimonadota bacterium]
MHPVALRGAETHPQEKLLVSRAVRGDQRAFNSLVESYQRRLFNYCFRMVGNAEDACDVTQEAFVKAWRNIGQFRVGEPFLPWLFRIAHNLCVDHLRRRNDNLSLDVEIEEGREPGDSRSNPETEAQESETRRAIEAAIADLPPKYRAVMMLRHGQGISLEEIAESLSLPCNTVKVHLHRAREQMRSRLKPLLETTI